MHPNERGGASHVAFLPPHGLRNDLPYSSAGSMQDKVQRATRTQDVACVCAKVRVLGDKQKIEASDKSHFDWGPGGEAENMLGEG